LILVSTDNAILPAQKDMHGILATVTQDAKGSVSESHFMLPSIFFQQKQRPGSPESRKISGTPEGDPDCKCGKAIVNSTPPYD
jgi:hypothetical protein